MQNQSALKRYEQKRDQGHASGRSANRSTSQCGAYVMHLHDASKLHFDLRLQWKGVLLSWALPNPPSFRPYTKRLAIRTEDHPNQYKSFEGVIPDGEYGAGTVLVWDQGDFSPLEDFDDGLGNGHLRFEIEGERLNGVWSLVRMNNFRYEKGSEQEQWLFVKERDRYSGEKKDPQIKEKNRVKSRRSHRTLGQIRKES